MCRTALDAKGPLTETAAAAADQSRCVAPFRREWPGFTGLRGAAVAAIAAPAYADNHSINRMPPAGASPTGGSGAQSARPTMMVGVMSVKLGTSA
jgi:hypothetical protein